MPSTIGVISSSEDVLHDSLFWVDAAKSSTQVSNAVTNLGKIGSPLNARYGSSTGGVVSGGALVCTGESGSFAQVPNSAALQQTGTIEIVLRVAADNWGPSPNNQRILSKRNAAAGQGMYEVIIGATGRLEFWGYADGTSALYYCSGPTNYGFVDGVAYWIKFVRFASTGVGTWYYATDQSNTEPTVWTSLTTGSSGGAGSLFLGTSPLGIGGLGDNGANGFSGKCYRAIIRSSAGGATVFDADFSGLPDGTQTFYDSTGQRVSMNPDANDPTLITHSGTNHLFLPNTNGNYAYVPYTTAFDLVGDMELVARIAPTTWSPAGERLIIAHPYSTNGYYFSILNKQISFGYCIDSSPTTLRSSFSGVYPSVPADNIARWVKVTRQSSSGNISFYWADDSPTEPSSWTLLGVVAGVSGNLATNTNVFGIGGNSSSSNFDGKIFRIIARNGIGGSIVADIDFSAGIQSGDQLSVPSTTISTVDYKSPAVYVSNLGTGNGVLDARKGSSVAVDTNDPTWLEHTGTNYLYLPGVVGNYASTPDSAALDVAGDLEIVCRVNLESFSVQQGLVSKATGAAPVIGYEFYVGSTGFLFLRWGNGTSTNTFNPSNSLSAAGLVVGTTYWLKVTLDVDNGASGHQVNFFWAVDSATEPTSWNSFSQPAAGVGISSVSNSAVQVGLGAYYNGTAAAMQGKMFRAIVRSGINGTIAIDADFTTGITTGSQATFTESSVNAATVTINRSTSGKKSAAVTRPVFLFGTDDFLEIQDSNILDFSASDSMTVVICVRQWNTPLTGGRFISKANSGTITGWHIPNNTTTLSPLPTIGDGIASVGVSPTPLTAGAAACIGFKVDRTAQTLTSFNGTTLSASASTSAIGSLANAYAMRIGSIGQFVGSHCEMELFGAAIFRKAISDSELSTIVDHYNGTVTTSSTNLLKSAEFWIDANLSGQSAVIARTSSGKKAVAVTRPIWVLGSDDFFDVSADGLNTYLSLPGTAGNYVSTPYVALDSGTASAGSTSSTFVDTTKTWTTNAFVQRWIRITGGTGAGQVRQIGSNTATTITINSSWTTIPDATSTYFIGSGFNVTGDIELWCRISMDSWNPLAETYFLGKYDFTNNLRSYALGITPTGYVSLRNSPDGSTVVYRQSSIPVPFSPGQTYWIRATLDVDSGSGTNVTNFYWANDQASDPFMTLRPLGSAVSVAGVTSIMGNATQLEIGSLTSGQGGLFSGKIFNAIVKDGLNGTTVAQWRASGYASTASPYRDRQGHIWSVNGGSVALNSSNPLNFLLSDSFTVIAVVRVWDTPSSASRYVTKGSGGLFGSWSLYNNTTTQSSAWGTWGSTSGSNVIGSSTSQSGSLRVYTGMFNSATGLTAWLNNTVGSTTVAASVDGWSNDRSLTIGSDVGYAYADMELVSAAVFKRALNANEIATIVAKYIS